MSYSVDLRERIVQGVLEQRLSIAKAAEVFQVGSATVQRYLRQYRQKGDLRPRTSPGRPSLLKAEQQELLEEQLKEDMTLDERCLQWEKATGVRVSTATMCRWIKKLEMTRKKRR